MVKIFGIDIPLGLEDLWSKAFQFRNNSIQDNFVLKTTMPTRQKKAVLYANSLFVRWGDLYSSFDFSRKSSWTYYWGTLSFSDHVGSGGWPGSGFSAFVYINAPRYKDGLDLLLDPPGFYLLDQSQTSFDVSVGFGNEDTEFFICQSFIPSVSYNLSRIISYIGRSFSVPVDSLACFIYSDSLDAPGILLGTSDDLCPGSSLVSSFHFQNYNFSTPLFLTSGVKYWIVLGRTGSSDSSAYFTVRSFSASDIYPSGRILLGNKTLSSFFSPSSIYDMQFWEYYRDF